MKRLLVIDDDPDFRTVISTYFSKSGFEVATASGKGEALEKVAAFLPGIILLDVLLSGTDGREFCRQLKTDAATSHIPVILFSAHPGAGDQIAHYGADDFIAKPFPLQRLLERVVKHMDKVSP